MKRLMVLITLLLFIVSIEAVLRQRTNSNKKIQPKAPEFASSVQPLVDSQMDFAFAMYDQLVKPQENLFFSPFSIHTALSMTYEGARNATASEMADVLRLDPDSADRLAATSALSGYLMQKRDGCVMKIANGIWVDQQAGQVTAKSARFKKLSKSNLLSAYAKTVTNTYKAQIQSVNFKTQAEPNRLAINEWVEKATEQKIKNLFEQGSIDSSTIIVLVNAIYFKGLWEKQFNKNLTKDEPFYTDENKQINVPMMRMTGHDAEFKYAEIDDVQIVEMPYACKDFSMVLLLPKESNLALLEHKLNKDSLRDWLLQLKKHRVDVYVPRFKVTTKYVLNEPLKKLGMPLAFSSAADFSGIDGTNSLFISLVVHQAFVDVNEEGTEAAAATGIVMTKSAFIPTKIPVFRADHPFIFVIKDNKTNAVLLMGKVVKP